MTKNMPDLMNFETQRPSNPGLDQRHRGALRRLFDQEFCIGRITPAGGVIARSTNPLRVGARAFDADVFEADAVRLTAMDFEGAAREDVWLRVPVAEPCP